MQIQVKPPVIAPQALRVAGIIPYFTKNVNRSKV